MSTINPTSTEPAVITFITHPRFQLAVGLLAIIPIILFSVSGFLYRPYDGLTLSAESNLENFDLYIPGPAYSAGFLVGDRILAVNGKPIDPWMQSPIYSPGLQPGDRVVYQVERQGKIFEIPLILGSYLDNPGLLLLILGMTVLSVIFWLIGVVICQSASRHDIRARMVGLCWILAGIAMAAGGSGTRSLFWGSGTILLVSWALLGFCLVVAHSYFPFQLFTGQQRRVISNVLAGLALFIALIVIIDDLFLKPRNLSFTNYGFPFSQVVYFWFFGAVICSILMLFWSRFRSKNREARRQTGIILWGMILGFGPFFIFTLVPIMVFGDQSHSVDGGFTVLFTVFVPIVYAYVIHQRRLLIIDAVLNRMIVFFTLLIGVMAIFFGGLWIVAISFKLPKEFPVYGSLIAAMAAIPATLLEKKAQMQVNRILYGTYYDHAMITVSLSGELSHTVDRETLNGLLTRQLCNQMSVFQARLYLVEGGTLCSQEPLQEPSAISLEDELCRVLKGARHPIQSVNLWMQLPEQVSVRWSNLNWVQIFVPIIFENELVGLLILGGRPSGDIYSAQDIEILDSVAHQAALAVANIRLVDRLRGLSHRLVQADEDRRKTIANELHDTILQDLFFLKQEVLKVQNATHVSEHMDTLINRLRGTIHEQRPDLLNAGLVLALKGLVQEMNKMAPEMGSWIVWHSGIENGGIFKDPLAITVYRIAQEAITNSLKHAHAQFVEVNLECPSPGLLCLQIRDDGNGLNKPNNNWTGNQMHFGLELMEERAAMIHGQLRIESLPKQGTLVELQVNYEQ